MYNKKRVNLAKYILLREILPASNKFRQSYYVVLPRDWKEIEWWVTGYNSS